MQQLQFGPKVTLIRAPVQQIHCWSGLGSGLGKGIQTMLLPRPAQQLTAVLKAQVTRHRLGVGVGHHLRVIIAILTLDK